jgi:tRNA(Ile)-lysidine synthase
MLKQIRKTIETHSMLERGDHVIVAVSGGPDSVALLCVLVLLTDEYGLRLTTAHLNHGLRGGESDAEETFVRSLCAKIGIACVCQKTDIRLLQIGKRRSLEEIGREERYRFLCETAKLCGAGKIAVGHHRDDQAETVLLHLLRGSGTEGLRGILPVREGRIIRPLLDVGRDDILEFLRREGAVYMTDSSNRDIMFLRNRIRKELIPILTAHYNPRLVEGLCRTAGIIRREDDYLKGVVRQIIESWGIHPDCGEAALPLAHFRLLHESIQARVIKCLLEGASPLGNGIGYRHVEAVLLLTRRVGGGDAALDLPFGIRVTCDKVLLRIRREKAVRQRKRRIPLRYEYQVEIPSTMYLKEIESTMRLEWIEKPGSAQMKDQPDIAFMDYECLSLPLTVRNMRPGDRVKLLGTGGTKKLKEYFIERHIPYSLRNRIPLLVDMHSIVWIGGERISESVRVTQKTKRVLRAQIVPEPLKMI